jgi:hypothetical protein
VEEVLAEEGKIASPITTAKNANLEYFHEDLELKS